MKCGPYDQEGEARIYAVWIKRGKSQDGRKMRYESQILPGDDATDADVSGTWTPELIGPTIANETRQVGIAGMIVATE